jgi:hypothetical protein
MGMFDDIKKKATAAVDQHGDKIATGIDKAAGMADKKTKGQHSDKIDAGVAKAKDALDKLDGRNDDIPDEPQPKPRPKPHPPKPQPPKQ